MRYTLAGASIQFDMLFQNPYKFTSDYILFMVYAYKNELIKNEYENARKQFSPKDNPVLELHL